MKKMKHYQDYGQGLKTCFNNSYSTVAFCMLEMNIHDADYEFSHDEVMIDFYVKDSCHTNIQWVLRWVSLLCMQTCWYGFHGCILVPSHKCDYHRQVPKRELHELACHLQTIHLSQMHVFNFINSKQLKVNLEVHFQFKMKSIFISKFSLHPAASYAISFGRAERA